MWCSALGFVDDHILIGHPQATFSLSSRLTRVIEYPADAFQEVATRSLSDLTKQLAHIVSLDLVIEMGSAMYRSLIVSQTQ